MAWSGVVSNTGVDPRNISGHSDFEKDQKIILFIQTVEFSGLNFNFPQYITLSYLLVSLLCMKNIIPIGKSLHN